MGRDDNMLVTQYSCFWSGRRKDSPLATRNLVWEWTNVRQTSALAERTKKKRAFLLFVLFSPNTYWNAQNTAVIRGNNVGPPLPLPSVFRRRSTPTRPMAATPVTRATRLPHCGRRRLVRQLNDGRVIRTHARHRHAKARQGTLRGLQDPRTNNAHTHAQRVLHDVASSETPTRHEVRRRPWLLSEQGKTILWRNFVVVPIENPTVRPHPWGLVGRGTTRYGLLGMWWRGDKAAQEERRGMGEAYLG